MGKPMFHLLVQELINRNKLKCAYGVTKKNDLQKEFLHVYQKCKERGSFSSSKDFVTPTRTPFAQSLAIFITLENGPGQSLISFIFSLNILQTITALVIMSKLISCSSSSVRIQFQTRLHLLTIIPLRGRKFSGIIFISRV
ncbi:uncharacterized protein LOC127148624 [Cucumis melo]|uniref:Uncharacterized protein LOC127148624 n=1 Tax=Cucumis melo TaxID=3656 RepID=A0ABM3KLR1_CUCME|nr:uncharacterized protein LOC127148624 [Cucumis melo]